MSAGDDVDPGATYETWLFLGSRISGGGRGPAPRGLAPTRSRDLTTGRAPRPGANRNAEPAGCATTRRGAVMSHRVCHDAATHVHACRNVERETEL